MMPKNREERIQKTMETCKHFNGTMNNTCAIGVNYKEVAGGGTPGWGVRLPCNSAFKDRQLAEGIQVGVCNKREYPTREEAIAEEDEREAVTERFLNAARAAHEDAKFKGFGKGHGGSSNAKCPNCETGKIYYSVSGYNGHMYAKCTTDGCVSWME